MTDLAATNERSVRRQGAIEHPAGESSAAVRGHDARPSVVRGRASAPRVKADEREADHPPFFVRTDGRLIVHGVLPHAQEQALFGQAFQGAHRVVGERREERRVNPAHVNRSQLDRGAIIPPDGAQRNARNDPETLTE